MKIACFIGLSLLLSCAEWTPEATGSFTVGQEKYTLTLATVDGSELYFRSKPGYYIQMTVFSNNGLTSTSYPFVYQGSSSARIPYIRVLRGITNEISSDINTIGTLTVVIQGKDYTFDFSGTIQGREVQLHYHGLIQII